MVNNYEGNIIHNVFLRLTFQFRRKYKSLNVISATHCEVGIHKPVKCCERSGSGEDHGIRTASFKEQVCRWIAKGAFVEGTLFTQLFSFK